MALGRVYKLVVFGSDVYRQSYVVEVAEVHRAI